MDVEYGFHPEAIITGCIDSFCLACEEYLKCERDVSTHISKPVHRKNLLTVHYVDKYRDDHIRKVKKGYFCELCNLLLPTAAKVGLHVAEPRHVDNKATKLLKRIGNTVIALGNVSISERAWHGLMEDTCAICNVEYDNEDIHKNQPSHIIRLIQCKVQNGTNNNIYRLIDNDTFQCLICNVVLPLKATTEHFNNSDHQKLYSEYLVSADTEKLNNPAINYLNKNGDQESIEKQTKQDNINEKIKNSNERTQIEFATTAGNESRKKILNSLKTIQRSDINIDFETQSAICKKCLITLEFNLSLIEQHIQEHELKPKKTANSALSYPNVDQKHKKTRLTPSDESSSEPKTSKDTTKITTNHINKQLKPLEKVIQESECIVISMRSGEQFLVINKKIILPIASFLMVIMLESTMHCGVCNVNITSYDLENHTLSLSHIYKMGEIPVITYLDTEFVREVRPDFYHCGYCNKIVSGWNNLLDHLQCPEHTSVKIGAKSLLDKLLREMDDEPDRRLMIDRVKTDFTFF